jgi:GntR family transcriptional regulator/MocR family aminotransferase
MGGLLEIPPVESGMYLTAGLPKECDDREVVASLAAADVVAQPLSSLALATPRPPGLVLGYAGHSEPAMARAAERMAAALVPKTGLVNKRKAEVQAYRFGG